MWKKSFGVALGALLVSVASYGAGCSTTTTVTDTGDGGGSGGDGSVKKDTGGPGDDSGGGGDDGSQSCPGAAPTKADLDNPDGAPGWNPPKPRNTTACSVSDISAFGANLNNQNLTSWDDLVKGLPTTCAQCILSRESDAHWQLVVADATGANGFVNWGACYAVAPHGSNACGQAVQYLNFCTDISCNSCPDAQFQSCTQAKATTSACDANFGQALTSSCDQTNAQALDDACGSAVNAASVLCGTGLPDGGTLGD